MTDLPIRSIAALVVLLGSCKDANVTEIVRVSLMNTETYRYPTFVGDEEGASISTQAKHYAISEIRRDSSTNWDAVYVFQPAASYVGSDYAEIKIFTGSDGASPNTRLRRVRFYFDIQN